jgi:hypothetical protein
VSGTVSLPGGVKDLDSMCGNGISWSVDRFDGSSNAILASGAFPNGGMQNSQDGVGGAALAGITIREGEFLYVVIDPVSSDHYCDSTGLTMVIEPVAVASPIPVDSAAVLLAIAAGLFVVGTISLGGPRRARSN